MNEYNISSVFIFGSAQLTGEAPGLQIRCEALEPSRVGSIPMHFRHFFNPKKFFVFSLSEYRLQPFGNTPASRCPAVTISCRTTRCIYVVCQDYIDFLMQSVFVFI